MDDLRESCNLDSCAAQKSAENGHNQAFNATMILLSWFLGISTNPEDWVKTGLQESNDGDNWDSHIKSGSPQFILPFDVRVDKLAPYANISHEEDPDCNITSSYGRTCFNGHCLPNVFRLLGSHGVQLCDGSKVWATRISLKKGLVDGRVVKMRQDEQLTFVGTFKNGRPIGPCFNIDPYYLTILYGNLSQSEIFGDGTDPGSYFTGEDITSMLILNTDMEGSDRVSIANTWAIRGAFDKGIMTERVERWTLTGVTMNPLDANDFPRISLSPNLTHPKLDRLFHAPPNLKNDAERFLGQCMWQRMQFEDAAVDRDCENKDFIWPELVSTPLYRLAFGKLNDSSCHVYPYFLRKPSDFYHYTRWTACYPGSGSKFFLDLLTQLSDHPTEGVVEAIKFYRRNGYFSIKNHHQPYSHWVNKTWIYENGTKEYEIYWERFSENIQWRLLNVASSKGRNIVLLRNPYEAILSHWTHDLLQSYNTNETLMFRQPFLDMELFDQFAQREAVLWEELYLDFISFGSHNVVVFYEELRKDWKTTMKQVLEEMGIEYDEHRADCAFRYRKLFDRKLRKNAKIHRDPFSAKARARIELALARVQEALRLNGHRTMDISSFKWRH